ncbi:MAG: S-layer homology domain-containing protein [Clostridia bacterium]|nr:S-layer homology domain-containing protein [Clostridia bacterium]
MRKFIIKTVSIMLTLVMVSGIIPAKSSVYASSASQEIAVEAIDALHTFGFIANYYDYNADFEGNATRADFFDVLYKILNAGEYSTEQLYYYDVPANHWAYKSISYLTEAGVISGSGDKLCRPDERLAFNEACAAALNAMGYGTYAQSLGEYPTGYTKAAAEIGITKNVSHSDYLTRRDMFILLYNVATTNIPKSIMLNGYRPSANKDDEDRTLLSMNHNIYYNKGIVSAANCISLDGRILENPNEVIIGGNKYISEIELFNFMGEETKFFFRYDEQLDKKTVIWANLTGKTKVLNITVNHDAVFNPETFQLNYAGENSRMRYVDIEKGVSLIYNGGLVTENLSEIFSKDEYELKLVQDFDGKYSIAVVRAYFNVVAGTIDSKEYVIYDKVVSGNNVNLDPDNYAFIKMTQMGEVDIEFENISENAVLSVYKSKDNKFIEIIKSGKTAEGVLEKIRNEEEGEYFTVDKTEYFCSNSSADSGVKVGVNVKLYLDFADKIAFAEYNASNLRLAAYLINGKTDEEETSIRIKTLCENGKVEYLYTAEKVRIDGKLYKNTADMMSKLSDENNVFKSQFVLYVLNDDGKIKEIDTQKYNKDIENKDSLQVDVEYSENMRFKTTGILGPLALLDANTKLFVIPQRGNIHNVNIEALDVIKIGDIENDVFLNAETYKIKNEGGIAEYAVVYGYSRSGYKNAVMPVLVSSISETLNENDEVVECLKGYQANNYVELKVESGKSIVSSNIGSGSLVRVGLNADKEISMVDVLYHLDGDYRTSSSDLNNNYRTVVGYAHSYVDGVLYIGEDRADIRTLGVKTSGVPILAYDSDEIRENAVRSAVIDEVKTYKNGVASPSKVVILTRFMAPALIVIYK